MDVYYNPQNFGLTVMGDVNWEYEDYSFDFTAVWKHENGSFYMGRDSGCSCPSPFEYVDSLDKLNGPLSVWEVITELNSTVESEFGDPEYINAENYASVIAQVGELSVRLLNNRQENMATIKDSQKQENRLAKELGGSVNSGSGNGWRKIWA